MNHEEKNIGKSTVKNAFLKSLPVFCSYIFVGAAYGMMMENAGFHWYCSLFVSLSVYTGAFQFVLITFLSGSASIVTVALTALLMNSRQSFYSLTFIDDFKKTGKKLLYMIHTMTDETYAVNLTLETEYKNETDRIEKENISDGEKNTLKNTAEKKKLDSMFFVALFSRCYWMLGSVLGGIIGQLLPFELDGIDFCMTALFVIIFIDRWESSKEHKPALIGAAVALVCLLIFGSSRFMLPALLIVSGILLLMREKKGETT